MCCANGGGLDRMTLRSFGKQVGAGTSREERRSQPVVGWRVWALREGRLASWAVPYTWAPGENLARCLVPPRPMGCIPPPDPHRTQPPGRGCGCGFWALFSPLQALDRARSTRHELQSVLGLVRGWGAIAVHGSEGFRAERAEVLCLFRDWCWDSPLLSGHPAGVKYRIGLLAWRFRGFRPAPNRHQELEQAASAYGVPLLPLHTALTHGVLAEFGVDPLARRQVEDWVVLARAGRAASGRERLNPARAGGPW